MVLAARSKRRRMEAIDRRAVAGRECDMRASLRRLSQPQPEEGPLAVAIAREAIVWSPNI